MSIYTDILITLASDSSYKSKYNSLTKYYYKTEDYVLKDLIRKYSAFIAEAELEHKKKSPYNVRRVVQASKGAKDDLTDYCTQMKMSQKPEWQILAERYGWRPPI